VKSLGARPGAVVSGPTFAKEVGRAADRHDGSLSRCSIRDGAGKETIGPEFSRLYAIDIVGVEVGGAVKNVIAIVPALPTEWASSQHPSGAHYARACRNDASRR